MIDRGGAVVRLAVRTKRIFRRVEWPAHRPTEHQATRQPDGAQRLEAISILDNFCLERPRHNACTKTVGLDGVRDVRQINCGIMPLAQPSHGLLRGELRREGALGGIFWHRHAIMQPGGRQNHLKARRLTRRQHLGVGHHPANVRQIVCDITPLHREGRDAALFPFRKINHHRLSKSFAPLRTTRITESPNG